MHRLSAHVRQYPLVALSLAAAIPLLVRCSSPPTGQKPASHLPVEYVPPQRLHTEVSRAADGSLVRSFSGPAAPQNLEFSDTEGTRRRIDHLFPNDHCPFAIDTAKQLGAEGYALTVVDRTLAGLAPTALDAVWPLNMVPFGVVLGPPRRHDGVAHPACGSPSGDRLRSPRRRRSIAPSGAWAGERSPPLSARA